MSSRRRAAPTRRRSMSWRKASAAPAGLRADVAAAEGRHVAVGEAGEAVGSGNGERALERRVAAGEPGLLAGGDATVGHRSPIAGGSIGGAESLGFSTIHLLQRIGVPHGVDRVSGAAAD